MGDGGESARERNLAGRKAKSGRNRHKLREAHSFFHAPNHVGTLGPAPRPLSKLEVFGASSYFPREGRGSRVHADEAVSAVGRRHHCDCEFASLDVSETRGRTTLEREALVGEAWSGRVSKQ